MDKERKEEKSFTLDSCKKQKNWYSIQKEFMESIYVFFGDHGGFFVDIRSLNNLEAF